MQIVLKRLNLNKFIVINSNKKIAILDHYSKERLMIINTTTKFSINNSIHKSS